VGTLIWGLSGGPVVAVITPASSTPVPSSDGINPLVDSVSYPEWFDYPSHTRPPDWVHELLEVVEAARPLVDSAMVDELTSDKVLAHLRPGLLKLGYEVEGGKHRAEKIRRPVLFGDQGRERVAYEVDAVHDELGTVLEVEAGRRARGNAVYRDLVRSSLIVDQRLLGLGVMRSYRHQSAGRSHHRVQLPGLQGSAGRTVREWAAAPAVRGVLLFGHRGLEERSQSASSVAWCSAAIRSAPDRSALLTLDASSIQTDPDGTSRIVWMIKRMIKAHPTEDRMPRQAALG
jgi:hypothetical protein